MPKSESVENMWRDIVDELEALESMAGIAEEMDRIRDGRTIPLNWTNENSRIEEIDWGKDFIRRKTRDAYFSVEDVQLRKKLIATKLEEEDLTVIKYAYDVNKSKERLRVVDKRLESMPSWIVAIKSVVGVSLGYFTMQTPGAVAGLLLGYYWGQHSGERQEAEELIKRIEEELRYQQKILNIAMIRPTTFSTYERRTGRRDNRLN